MTVDRPSNHVTRAMEAVRQSTRANGLSVWPEVPEDLLLHLEALYPGRCYDHRAETLEDHLVYSGAANLVADLRLVFEDQKAAALAADPEDPEELAVEVEPPEQED